MPPTQLTPDRRAAQAASNRPAAAPAAGNASDPNQAGSALAPTDLFIHRHIGPDASDPATGISVTTATRASAAFRTVYGFDAGGPEPPMLSQPDRSVFAKVTWQPSSRHRVELSHNWVDAWDENLSRTPRIQTSRPVGWQLSRSGMSCRM